MPEIGSKNEPKSIRDQLSERAKSGDQTRAITVKSPPTTSIRVHYNHYLAVKDIVDVQLRRKLAGEFPYNVLEREIVTSTGMFWQSLQQRNIVVYAQEEYPDLPFEVIQVFFDNIGKHPSAWNKYETFEELLDKFIEFVKSLP